MESQQETTQVNILDGLDELDKIIIRYKIEGRTNVDIAEKIGRHRDTVKSRLEKIQVQQAIKEFQKTALDILLGAQADAARELRRQLKKGATDKDKREAAKEILKGVLSDKINLTGNVNVIYADNQDKEL